MSTEHLACCCRGQQATQGAHAFFDHHLGADLGQLAAPSNTFWMLHTLWNTLHANEKRLRQMAAVHVLVMSHSDD
jgi:hypothetical protein